MNRKPAALTLAAVVLCTVFGISLLGAQEQSATETTRTSSPAKLPEVFCTRKPAGQLCGHGTADALKLTSEKREQWTAAVNRYNQTVDAATKQLLEQAKSQLSPEEFARVQKWFDQASNAQLNRALAEK